MKYSRGIVVSVTLFIGFVLSGCDGQYNNFEYAENSVIETNLETEFANSEVQAELRLYRKEDSDRIQEYNRIINNIKEKIRNETDWELRIMFEKRLDEHKATYRKLKQEIDNYKASEKGNLNDFQVSFSSRMDDLDDSLMNLFSAASTTTLTLNQP